MGLAPLSRGVPGKALGGVGPLADGDVLAPDAVGDRAGAHRVVDGRDPVGDRVQTAGTRSGEVIVAVGMCAVLRRASSQYSRAGTSRPITQEMSAPPSGSTSGPV